MVGIQHPVTAQPPGGNRLYNPLVDAILDLDPVARVLRLRSDGDGDCGSIENGVARRWSVGRSVPDSHAVPLKSHTQPPSSRNAPHSRPSYFKFTRAVGSFSLSLNCSTTRKIATPRSSSVSSAFASTETFMSIVSPPSEKTTPVLSGAAAL